MPESGEMAFNFTEISAVAAAASRVDAAGRTYASLRPPWGLAVCLLIDVRVRY
jgi:hypothetical protein